MVDYDMDGFPTEIKIIKLHKKLVDKLHLLSCLNDEFWRLKIKSENKIIYIQGNIYRMILKLDKLWDKMEEERIKVEDYKFKVKFIEDFVRWTFIKGFSDDEIIDKIIMNITTSGQIMGLVEKIDIRVI